MVVSRLQLTYIGGSRLDW